MYLCVNDFRCADKIDGHPREVNGPNDFCPRCLDRTEERIAGLPAQHLRLHAIIGDHHAGVDAGIRRPKPGATIPLNVHVDTLMGDIEQTASLAAELLADGSGQPDPSGLYEQCVLVAPNVARLVAFGPIDVMYWIGGTELAVDTITGVDVLARLDGLAALAHFTLGQTLARIHRHLPCTRCQAYGVGRWAGSNEFDCAACGSRFNEEDLRRQDQILLRQIKMGLVSS